jgi:hypothetical protein
MLCAGSLLWAGPAYGAEKQDLDEQIKETVAAFDDPQLRVVEQELPLRFEIGKRLVLVHAGEIDPDSFDQPDLIVFEKDGKRSGIQSLQLARVSGKFIVWKSPGSAGISISMK